MATQINLELLAMFYCTPTESCSCIWSFQCKQRLFLPSLSPSRAAWRARFREQVSITEDHHMRNEAFCHASLWPRRKLHIVVIHLDRCTSLKNTKKTKPNLCTKTLALSVGENKAGSVIKLWIRFKTVNLHYDPMIVLFFKRPTSKTLLVFKNTFCSLLRQGRTKMEGMGVTNLQK